MLASIEMEPDTVSKFVQAFSACAVFMKAIKPTAVKAELDSNFFPRR
jgi:hypothetical protein